MKRLLLAVALGALCLSAMPNRSHAPSQGRGALVIVGGGGTPDGVLVEALALTGKDSPRVLILPQASSLEDRGVGSVKMWREQGVEHVQILEPLDRPDALELLEACDLLWIPGGSQRDLMRTLAGHNLVTPIARLHSKGKVVAGTSAGAAVMGAVMISGEPDPAALVAGGVTPYRGLGLWPSAIVDQHFIERDRYGRLLTAVLSKPRFLGVGIGERAALVVQGDDLRVIGEGQVVFYDARKAKVKTAKPGELQAGRDLRLHVLETGESWTWFQ